MSIWTTRTLPLAEVPDRFREPITVQLGGDMVSAVANALGFECHSHGAARRVHERRPNGTLGPPRRVS